MPTAVITGASKGIGKALCLKFAENGYNIALYARDMVYLKTLAEDIQSKFPQIKVFVSSVNAENEEEVKAFALNVLHSFDDIEVVINNAGTFIPGSVLEEEDGVLETTLKINLLSAYHLTRILTTQMISNGKGHIFNISSIAGIKAYPGGGSYSISKYALQGFSDNLRYELMHKGIKVTVINPGAVYTNSWSESGVDPNRLMQATDVAEVIFNTSQLSPQATVEQIIMRPQSGDI